MVNLFGTCPTPFVADTRVQLHSGTTNRPPLQLEYTQLLGDNVSRLVLRMEFARRTRWYAHHTLEGTVKCRF